jgi:hypothetical protein
VDLLRLEEEGEKVESNQLSGTQGPPRYGERARNNSISRQMYGIRGGPVDGVRQGGDFRGGMRSIRKWDFNSKNNSKNGYFWAFYWLFWGEKGGFGRGIWRSCVDFIAII